MFRERFGIEVVPSQFVDLGRVDPEWHTHRGRGNMFAEAQFETRQYRDGSHIVEAIGTLSAKNTIPYPNLPSETVDPALVDDLAKVVGQIDELYRSHREIPHGTILYHNAQYRAGRARGIGALHHTLTLNLLPFNGPGFSHLDGMKVNEEAVIVSHDSVPTTLYSGPLPVVQSRGFLAASTSRFFAKPNIRAARDSAILIDRNTLHRTSAQIHNPFRPGAFLRTVISTEKPVMDS